MRVRAQPVRGLVETDVTIRADAEDLQVDAVCVGDLRLIPAALGFEIRSPTIEHPDVRGIDRDVIEQLRLHERAIAAGLTAVDPHELIEIEGADLRPIEAIAAAALAQFAIERQRRTPGR